LLGTTREILIYSGIRDSAEIETMGEFLRATVTEWETDKTTASYGLNLTCRVAAVNETLQTRALEGVIETKSEAGRRSIRAAVVNHRLRPGDTVTHGATSFVAHNVTYAVGINGAWMEVQEAPSG
jgi:plastocyanin